jgi:hypothetical protein
MISIKNKLFAAACFLLIIFCALFVRIYGLSEYAFNDDEMWHLTVASQKNIWELIKYNFAEEIHPPLSYIIWHLMLRVSDNDLWLRMSSIIPGILLIPSIYLFGRLYIGKAAAVFLALLFAFGAVPVTISTTIRAYSLMMLALTWAAIFVHKYRFEIDAKSRNKFLFLYSICGLLAIELNHAACFVLFALGLILIFQTLKEKNKKDFVLIASIHAALMFMVAAYAYVLKAYYGFHGITSFFSTKEFLEYWMRYLVMFLRFFIAGQPQDFAFAVLTLLSFAAFFSTPILLIRRKSWLLLHLIFTPLCVVIICDYLKVYPFSATARNNLFLFLGIAITYGVFAQILSEFFCRVLKLEKFLKNNKCLKWQFCLKITVIFSLFFFCFNNNFFRQVSQNCAEFSIKKSDRDLLNEELKKRNNENNIFVTMVRNLWQWRLLDKGNSNIVYITENLARYQNKEITIYFTAFPAIEFSVVSSMMEYQLFFADLFKLLEEEGKLSKVRSFTFFDIGSKVDHISLAFHPQFIKEKQKKPIVTNSQYAGYKLGQESYDFGWDLSNNPKEVLSRFYSRDVSFECGREIIVFSVTPEFVKGKILNKNFIDWRKFDNEELYKNE